MWPVKGRILGGFWGALGSHWGAMERPFLALFRASISSPFGNPIWSPFGTILGGVVGAILGPFGVLFGTSCSKARTLDFAQPSMLFGGFWAPNGLEIEAEMIKIHVPKKLPKR